MQIEEIFEALSEGRISFNEAVQLLMQAGFSGEFRSVPMIIQRERITQRPQERKVIVGKVIDQHEKEKRDIPYCDICKVYFADANRDLQMLVGKKLCSECVREVIEKLQNKGEEPTIRELNSEFVKTEKPMVIPKRKKGEIKNE